MKASAAIKMGAELAAGLANPKNWRTFHVALQSRKMQPKGECPICGYKGPFEAGGILMPRMNAVCPQCKSWERNRLLRLAIGRGAVSFEGKRILHFAPEGAVKRFVDQSSYADYTSADIEPGRAMRQVDIEAMNLEDGAFDVVLCSHVLEHVDHRKALAEMYRVLAPGGFAVLMFPIIEAWAKTYEDPRYQGTPEDRIAHYAQDNHIKYFGRDIRDHIRTAGFDLEEFAADGPDSARYALMRGETIFLARKAVR